MDIKTECKPPTVLVCENCGAKITPQPGQTIIHECKPQAPPPPWFDEFMKRGGWGR